MLRKTTRTIAGHDFTLVDWRRYLAGRPMLGSIGHEGLASMFPVSIRDITPGMGAASGEEVARVEGLTLDGADALLAAFNDGEVSLAGRIWGEGGGPATLPVAPGLDDPATDGPSPPPTSGPERGGRMDAEKLRRIWDNGACGQCAHLRPEGERAAGRPVCDAFPEGIPLPVLSGDFEHFAPIEGDHGIVFEPIAGADDSPPEPESQCSLCRRYSDSDGEMACRAFPRGIPDEISTNRFDHRRPYPGDRGVRFRPDRDADPEDLEVLYSYLDRLAPDA